MNNPESGSARNPVRTGRQLLPLTPAQQGMWFADRLSPDYSVNIAQYVNLWHEPGGLDIDLFMDCSYQVGRELETPYIRLTEVDGVPMQYVDVDYNQTIDHLDLRHEEDPHATAMAWMEAEFRRPVDLIDDQLIVVAILQISDEHTIWYQRAHHLIIDGYAALTNMRRVLDRYNAARRGQDHHPKPALTLSEIIDYEDSYLTSTRREADRAHWMDRVADLPERVTLARSSAQAPLSFHNVVAGQELDPVLQARLTALAGTLNSSLAVLMVSAFGAFLSRMTGADDIALSLPITGRANAKIKRSGGMVSNVVPIRLSNLSDTTPRELIDATLLELTGALRHQRYRSDDIRRDAGLDTGSMSFGPTINMVFFDEEIELDGCTVDYHILASGVLEDLFVNLYQSSPSAPVVVDLHGNPNLYSHREIERHLKRFLVFLERFTSRLDDSVAALDLLLDGEAESIEARETGRQVEWTDDQVGAGHLLDLFGTRVAETPESIAVISDGREWTYRQFDRVRRDLTRRLLDAGVHPGDRVAVELPRGLEQLAAVYAALSAGAAFVPIDVDLPQSRRELILRIAEPTLTIDQGWLEESGFAPEDVDVAAVVDLPEAPGGLAPAYVIFTSGSTGTPKGVQVSHRAILNRLAWVQADFPLTADDVWMYKTPATFDPSVVELFWPLQIGAKLVIAAPGGHRDPGYLRDLISQHGVTVMHFVPSMLDAFADAAPTNSPVLAPPLRRVFVSGEALSPSLADRALAGSRCELVNLYGPTEAAVDVTEHRAVRGEPIMPIGSVVANTRAYVLDRELQRTPANVPGELYLAGVQLAEGYVRATALTADRFVADPFSDGERMYRTGDLVRWGADGSLEYLGRTDFQVKIRGQRVELGEIEQALNDSGLIDAVVVLVRDGVSGPEIIGYVKAAADAPTPDVLVSDLLHHARGALAGYMVPSAIVVLDAFPTNSSGKLDRKALPEPETTAENEVEYVAPSSIVEHKLAEIVGELLGIERVGMHENLFSLGADSLTAARLSARIRAAGLRVDLAEVFDSRNLAEVAAATRVLNGGETLPALRPQARPSEIPLSYPQTRLWFINRLDPSAPTYNMPGAVRVPGSIDIGVLRIAVGDLIERHESLRTRFPSVAGEPVQEIVDAAQATAQIALTVHQTDEAGLPALLAVEAATGFDVVAGFPVRFTAATVVGDHGETSSVLMVVLHHIAGDGASLPPLITDLLTAYAARTAGEAPAWAPLPVQYADYTLWQREVFGDVDDPDSRLSRELEFWTAQLAGSPEVLALPYDRTRTGATTGAGDYVDAELGVDAVARLRELARAHGVTTFTVLHAALTALLSRIADTDDVAIGTAVAGRDEPELTGLIGMFVNTVVLRTQVRPGDTAAELLRHAHDVRTSALAHASVPFEAVVDAVAHRRSLSHTPLFQVALTLIADHSAVFGQADLEVLSARPPVAKYDLSVTAVESVDGRLSLEFSYASDVFTRRTVERFAEYLERIIVAMGDDADRAVGTIDLLPGDEIAALTAEPLGVKPQTLRDLLLEVERRHDPTALAVIGRESISHEVFAMRTNQLARELIARGAGPGDVVAVAMPRSELSVLACVAIAKTGAAFVSIDPRHPVDRREMMLAISGARLGLATADTPVDTHNGTEWVVVDDAAFELQIAGHSGKPIASAELRRRPFLDDPAYLIFTSGSTGTPKATVVPHRGLANVMANQRRVFSLTPAARVLHVASPSFDASVFELAMAVAGRGALVVADVHTYAGHDLERLIMDHRVTHAVMTPSALATIDPRVVRSLKTVLSAGEACPPELMRRWAEAGRDFFNLYGPTEATIWATCDGPLTVGDEITIGHAIQGVGTLVLDAGLQPTPIGVAGELYLTGGQLALGYLGRSGQTATSFVANPYEPAKRMYRTGDRVVRRADGRLVYLGRSDFQLKVRGMRIEPGEVDAVLVAHPAVRNATSLGVEGPAGESVLVSYVSAVEGESVSPDELLRHAGELLPSHMVPHTVLVVDEFPMTVVGKIDRGRLPAVDFSATTEFIPPRNEMEAVVAEVYAQVLGIDRVSVQDSFFELGGTSLSAAKLATQLSQVLGRAVSVKAVFEGGTVAGVAGALIASVGGRAAPALVAHPRAELVPISDVQRGMWLLNQADPASPAYNIAMALRLQGDLDLGALRAAVADLLNRQDALRTSYPLVGGRPVQLIEPADTVFASLDLTPHPVGADIAGAVGAVTGRGFDVTLGAPIRVAVLQLAEDEHVVVFVVHHIGADGASMAPLAYDFMTAYAARHAGHAPSWLPLRIQYADFAVWQQEVLEAADDGTTERDIQLDYWRERLAGAPECIDLPSDRPRPATPSYVGGTIDFELPADLVASLRDLARRHHTTLFMVTHAAFAILLARLSGQNDVVIGTPYAGRSEAALDELVGMFVNTLALRSQIDSGESFADFLERVRTGDLADMAHADVSFDSVAAAIGAPHTTAFNPVFQVMFTFQNLEFPTVTLDELTITPVSEELRAAKVDLQLTLFPNDPAALGGQADDTPMRAQFLYATDLFDEATARTYSERYVQVLIELVTDPHGLVGDISITTAAEQQSVAVAAERSLSELVADAALAAPETTALVDNGNEVAFSTLSVTASALAAAMPDADTALTTAVMSLAPTLAAAGPERLGEVLADLRARALAATELTRNERLDGGLQRP